MRVEVLLQRNSEIIVHEGVEKNGRNKAGTATMLHFGDGSYISYPYKNYSWIKVTPDGIDD